jgi:hypothetical protein
VNFAIWDLDNCLSDDGWRIRYVEWHKPIETRWNSYHRMCFRDEPGNHEEFGKTAAAGLAPMFITGRPESARALTMAWLSCHFDIRSPMLLMRANDDHRPSVDVKLELLTGALQRVKGRPRLAFDDKPDIVQMYRDVFDIDARLLSIHNIDAYKQEAA